MKNVCQKCLLFFFINFFAVFFIIDSEPVSAASLSCSCSIEVKNDKCLLKGSAEIKEETTIQQLKKFTKLTKLDPTTTICGITGENMWNLAMKDLDKQKIEIPEGVITQKWTMMPADFSGTCNFQVDNGSFYSSKEKTEFFGPGSSYLIACEGDGGDVKPQDTPAAPPAETYAGIPLDIEGIQAIGNKLNKTSASSFQQLFGKIIKTLSEILGSISLGMFVYGGILIMTDAGSSERREKGVRILVWSALGVIIILSAYTLVKFVLEII